METAVPAVLTVPSFAARPQHQIIGPAQGDLACGCTGTGRLVDEDEIVNAILAALA